MSEKITRAQAEAAFSRIVFNEPGPCGVCGHDPECHPTQYDEDGESPCVVDGCGCPNYGVGDSDDVTTVRAYLAQQPSDDVVRKAHPALRRLADRGRTVAYVDSLLHVEDVLDVLAALPPMPEVKEVLALVCWRSDRRRNLWSRDRTCRRTSGDLEEK